MYLDFDNEQFDNFFELEFEQTTEVSDGGFDRGYKEGYAKGDEEGKIKGRAEGQEIGYADALAKRTELVVTKNGEYTPTDGSTGFKSVSVNVGGENKLAQVLSKTVVELTEEDLRGATVIGSYAFYKCKQLTSVEIPEGVTEITDRPFNNTSYKLTKIVIPKSMAIFSDYAFYGADNAVVYIKDVASWLKITENRANPDDYYCSPRTYIRFLDNDGNEMTNITIPDGTESVRASAFYRANKIVSISIPNTVTDIGASAFSSCSALLNANIPDGVTIIANRLFNECSRLASITIPEGVTSIGQYAFYGCVALKALTIPAGVTSIGTHAFSNCKNIENLIVKATTPPTLASGMALYSGPKKITVPRGAKEAYDSATNWSSYAYMIVEGDV